MRPIPADSLGHAHGLLRAIERRGRLRTDEFVTEFGLDELFPPDLENALGRMRHFISFARAAGLVKEDRGVVELTEVGRRYIRSGEPDAPFAVGPQQAEWLRRQLREKHMTDSIFHGLSIGLSLLASTPPGTRVATLDFGRSMAYLGRAGWDNENTLQIQGERHLRLLQDMEMIDGEHRLTATGDLVRGELTLPVHMSLPDIAAHLNPGGAEAVRAAAAEEYAEPVPPSAEVASKAAAPPLLDDDGDDNGFHTVAGGLASVSPPGESEPEPARPPIVPRAASAPYPDEDEAPQVTSGDALAAEAPVVYPPPVEVPTVITPGTTPREGTAPPPVPASEPAAPERIAPVASAPASVAASPEPAAPVVAPPPAAASVPRTPPPSSDQFIEAWAVRAAAEEAGLRLADAIYANVAAALNAGKHLVLTGAPGSGKTTLALAVARAAAQAGRAQGATVITGAPARQLLIEAAPRGRWVIADELNQADADRALKPLSTLLAGVPVSLDGEVAEPAQGWRVIATWNGSPPRGATVLRRFAAVDVARPPADVLRPLLAQHDPQATEAVETLLALGAPLGAGVLIEAANHIRARQAATPTDAATLADEAIAAYLSPLIEL